MEKKALTGLRILDFTRVYSGPYCTMLLADLGAEVIKVEAVGKGDDSRNFFPVVNGVSGYYTYLNRNKKSLTLNLKSEEGRQIALELAKCSDIVVENFSAGAIGRLGLGYEDIVKVNPQIIYASISGFGQEGPYSGKAAYDAIAQAMGGMTYLTGYPDAEPVKVGPAISDAASGVHAAVAILAALAYRDRTGEGQYIDISMMDTVFSMLENAVPILSFTGQTPARLGNANPGSAPYNMYHTKDGTVFISTANNSLFNRLSEVMGQPDLIKDPRFCENALRKEHEREIDPIVEAWTLTLTTAEVEKLLDEKGIPVAHARSVAELIDDPQLQMREMVVEHDIPGIGKAKYPGNPLKLQKTPPQVTQRAPLLGENNHEILEQILGKSKEEIKVLQDLKVI